MIFCICFTSTIYPLYNFIHLNFLTFLGVSLAEGFCILFIFPQNQFFISLIFFYCLLVSISFISTLISVIQFPLAILACVWSNSFTSLRYKKKPIFDLSYFLIKEYYYKLTFRVALLLQYFGKLCFHLHSSQDKFYFFFYFRLDPSIVV